MTVSLGRRFVTTAVTFLVGNVLSKMVTFFLLPFYTASLNTHEFGTYDLWLNVTTFLAPVAFFQSWDAVYRFYFDDSDHDKLRTNGLLLLALGWFIYLTVMCAATQVIAVDHFGLVLMMGTSIALAYYMEFIARAELRNALFVVTGLVNSLVVAAVSVIGILHFEMGASALFAGIIVGNVVQVALLSAAVQPWAGFRIDRRDHRLMRRLVAFSAPLSVASVGYWLLSGLSRVAIVQVEGVEANGLFAVADRLAVAITMLSTVAIYAWNEILYDVHGEDKSSSVRGEGFKLIASAVFLGCALVVLVMPWVFDLLVDSSFDAARPLVPAMLLGAALNAVAGFAGSLHMADRHTGTVLWTTCLGGAVNAVLVWPVTETFGTMGAAITLASSFGVLLASRLVVSRADLSGNVLRTVLASASMLVAAIVAYYLAANLAAVIALGVMVLAFAAWIVRPHLVRV